MGGSVGSLYYRGPAPPLNADRGGRRFTRFTRFTPHPVEAGRVGGSVGSLYYRGPAPPLNADRGGRRFTRFTRFTLLTSAPRGGRSGGRVGRLSLLQRSRAPPERRPEPAGMKVRSIPFSFWSNRGLQECSSEAAAPQICIMQNRNSVHFLGGVDLHQPSYFSYLKLLSIYKLV